MAVAEPVLRTRRRRREVLTTGAWLSGDYVHIVPYRPNVHNTAMTTLAATELRNRGSEAINRVAYAGERVLLQRHGKNVAAIVSVEDLELLQALEDRIDLTAARKALKQKGRVAWDKVKADLNL